MHGWGGSQQRDLARAKGIAGLGCICLTFDLRGHASAEARLCQVSREDNLRDLVAAYDRLRGHPAIDTDAIAVVGTSYGGYLATILTSLRPVKWLALRVPAIYRDASGEHPSGSWTRPTWPTTAAIRYRWRTTGRCEPAPSFAAMCC